MKKSLYISITCLILFILLSIGIKTNLFLSLDSSIASYLFNPQGLILNLSQAIAIIFDALSVIIISFLISFILWFYRKKKQDLFFILASLTGAAALYILKNMIQRTRPENLIETGFSFPSGHATIAVLFIGTLIYLFSNHIKNKNTRIFFISILCLLILLVGFTRIYLHVHWFTDVLGGYLLGLFILFFYIYLDKRML